MCAAINKVGYRVRNLSLSLRHIAADFPDKRLTLQAVGRRTEIFELAGWGERTQRTQIVAIGAAIDARELSVRFDACIEQSQTSKKDRECRLMALVFRMGTVRGRWLRTRRGRAGLRKFIIATIFVFALSPLHGQIGSRAEQLEILRRDKVARLWPERQSEFVKLANKYVERGLYEDPGKGANGFQPMVLGGMRSGNGFSYGVGYRRSDLWRDRVGFRITARGTMAGAYMFDFLGEFPKLKTQKAFVDYYVKYENSPKMDYYGPGSDSEKANRTSYRLEDLEADVRAGYQLTNHFSAAARAGGYFANTGRGGLEGFPSTDDIFDPSQTPGLFEQADFFRWGGALRYDYRDNLNEPSRGGHYYLRFTQYSDRTLQRHSFKRMIGFAEQYIPYHNDTRVIALRLAGVTAFTDKGSGQTVPFYLQPTLGGNNRLRGFDRYRFYDATSVLAVIEHRWYVFSGLDAAVFLETGKVAPRNGLLNVNDLEWSGGISLRFKLRDNFFMRVDNAVSRESYRIMLTFGDVFGREKRW